MQGTTTVEFRKIYENPVNRSLHMGTAEHG